MILELAKKSSHKKSRRNGSITKNATKSLGKVAESVREKLPDKIPIEEIRNQLLSYSSDIERYLTNANAKVEDFKFSVEKAENSLIVDVAFKATISN
jgi:hypothetical protein